MSERVIKQFLGASFVYVKFIANCSQAYSCAGHFKFYLRSYFLSDHFLRKKASVDILDGCSDDDMNWCTQSLPERFCERGFWKRMYTFSKADDAAIMTYLAHEYLDLYSLSTEGSADRNEVWLQVKPNIMDCTRQFVPLIKRTTKKHNPWMTRDIINLKRKIKRLRKYNKSIPASHDCQEVNALNTDLKENTKEAIQLLCSITLSNFIKQSPNKFRRFISEAPLPPFEGAKQAKAFNIFFQSVFISNNDITPCFTHENQEHYGALGAPHS